MGLPDLVHLYCTTVAAVGAALSRSALLAAQRLADAPLFPPFRRMCFPSGVPDDSELIIVIRKRTVTELDNTAMQNRCAPPTFTFSP